MIRSLIKPRGDAFASKADWETARGVEIATLREHPGMAPCGVEASVFCTMSMHRNATSVVSISVKASFDEISNSVALHFSQANREH